MKCLPVLCLFLLSFSGQAQYIPDSATGSPEKFARYLQRFNDPSHQLRTLYSWITSNIRYDNDSAMYFNWNAGYDTKIAATLRRRKGVCENFASLFADIARRLNIPAQVVHGYPAYSDQNKDNSHSWVAVQDKGEWFLCDPTWDAQSATERYYMVQPAAFIQTHIPFDPLWQLLEHPVNYTITGSKFLYKDSVSNFLQMDSLQQFLATERRMKNTVNPNSMTRSWQSFNRMNVAIIAGENDQVMYNAAVGLLNRANKYFNDFIQYRNNTFEPQKTVDEIRQMLLPIPALLDEAAAKIREMGKLNDNFQYNPESILQKIASLEKRTGEQLRFLDIYLATDPAERKKLF